MPVSVCRVGVRRTGPGSFQDPVALLGTQGTLLAHGHPVIPQHTQVPLCRAALQQVSPKPVLVPGVVPPQVQDPALALVEPHQVPLSLSAPC